MIPLTEYTGGNCHIAVMLVEEIAVTVKFVGDRKGTEIKKKELSDLILSRQTLPVLVWLQLTPQGLLIVLVCKISNFEFSLPRFEVFR